MPRGSKISPALRQEWLEAYERGRGTVQIARETSRSVRTVKEHIARAQEERTQLEVRKGLLRTAYQRHFDDLMGAASRLQQQVHVTEGAGAPGNEDHVTGLLRQALRSHLPRSGLWKALETWRGGTMQQLAAREEAVRLFARRVEEELSRRGVDPRVIGDGHGWRESLRWALQQAVEGGTLAGMEYQEVPGEGDLASLAWGAFGLAGAVDAPTRGVLRAMHAHLVSEVRQSPVLHALREAQQRIRGARMQVDAEVDVVLLRRIVPGRCKLCPG